MTDFTLKSVEWMKAANARRYSYAFSWLGRPVIQYPQDLIALQQIVFEVKPSVIIETGVAHGGSAVFFSSLLYLNEICGGPTDAKVVAIEIALREENREAIMMHPLRHRISLLDGSSTATETVQRVRSVVRDTDRVLVVLDSNHAHDHVLSELRIYGAMVSIGSYCVVLDTIVEQLDVEFPGRDWGVGNNPATAVEAFLQESSDFVVDSEIDAQLGISVAPRGYLRRIR